MMTSLDASDREKEEPLGGDGPGTSFLPRAHKSQRAAGLIDGSHTSLASALLSNHMARHSSIATESPPLAVGPSELLLDNDDSANMSLGDSSPVPSQLTQQHQSQHPQLTRQRPRFHTVQDLDMALNQAIEGKINSKNAWASKEASNLLEGITHTIESTLEAHTSDDYSGFAKAATVVEGCSKVWTVRVDSTYNRSNQMVQRLLRNDDAGGGAEGANRSNAEDDGDGNPDAGSSGETLWTHRSRARARALLGRTVATEASEINLDAKARAGLCQVGVKAQFRALTEKFDQANAQGLLVSNAPLGRCANYIIDVDYSREPEAIAAAAASSAVTNRTSTTTHTIASTSLPNTSAAREFRPSGVADEAAPREPCAVNDAAAAAASSSNNVATTGVRESVMLDMANTASEVLSFVPEYNLIALLGHPFTEAGNNASTDMATANTESNENNTFLSSTSSSGGTGMNSNHSENETATVSLSRHLDAEELRSLVRRLTTSPTRASHGTVSVSHSARTSGHQPDPQPHNQPEGAAGDPYSPREGTTHLHVNDQPDNSMRTSLHDTATLSHPDTRGCSTHAEQENGENNEDDKDSDDMDDMHCDDFDNAPEDNDNDDDNAENEEVDALRFQRARNLVSGVDELEAMDELFPHRLALEADDPTAWCPLSARAVGEREMSRVGHYAYTSMSYPSSVQTVSALERAGYAGLTPRCELARLHRESRFGQSIFSQSCSKSSLASTNAASPAAAAGATPASRRTRTVVFELPESSADCALSASSPFPTFTLPGDANKNNDNYSYAKDSDALKQSRSAMRNITALGKEMLFGPGAASAALQCTQSSVQRSRAEKAGLLLPAAPIPGETIPSYLPYPISVATTFFQPFSTSVAAWSLLRKSASSALGGTRSSALAHASAAKSHLTNRPHPLSLSSSVSTAAAAAAAAAAGLSSSLALEDGIAGGRGGHRHDASDSHSRRSQHRAIPSDEDEQEDMPVDVFLRGGVAAGQGSTMRHRRTGDGLDGGDELPDGVDGGYRYENDEDDEDGGNHDFDGDDNDSAEEAAYGASVAQTEQQLLAQFNAIHDAARARTMGMSAWHTGKNDNTLTNHNEAGVRPDANSNLSPLDDATLLSALRNADDNTPNHMDVGALRQRMWAVLRAALQQRGWVLAAGDDEDERAARERILNSEGSHTIAKDDLHDTDGVSNNNATHRGDRGESADEEESSSTQPRGPMLKSHISAALARARCAQTARAEDEQQTTDTTKATANCLDSVTEGRGRLRGLKRARGEKEMTLGALCGGEVVSPAAPTPAESAAAAAAETTKVDTSALTLSTLVCSVLPWVSTFSSSGSLSAAFVFFTILFLANEHSVVLSSVETLDDLVIGGVAESAGQVESGPRPKRPRVRQAR